MVHYTSVIFPESCPCINYRILAFYAPIPVQMHGNSIIPLYHIQGNFGYRGILLYNVRIVQWYDKPVKLHIQLSRMGSGPPPLH